MIAIVAVTLPGALLSNIDTMASPWNILFGAVAPGIALFFIWAIPFDMLMVRLFMGDKPTAEKTRSTIVIRVDFVVWLILFVIWGRLFLQLLAER